MQLCTNPLKPPFVILIYMNSEKVIAAKNKISKIRVCGSVPFMIKVALIFIKSFPILKYTSHNRKNSIFFVPVVFWLT